MNPNGNSFSGSVTAWSEITMKVLLQRMDALGFGSEAGHLRSSLMKGRLQVMNKGNDTYNIAFSFNLYGRFVDMGVGREFRRGNDGRTSSGRKPKEWLSRYWWAQFQRLREIMRERYAAASTEVVLGELSQLMGNARTMRGFAYSVQQSRRNARNYSRRRALPGKWTNNYKTWKPM